MKDSQLYLSLGWLSLVAYCFDGDMNDRIFLGFGGIVCMTISTHLKSRERSNQQSEPKKEG